MASNENPWADQQASENNSNNNMQIHGSAVTGQAQPGQDPWQLSGQQQSGYQAPPQTYHADGNAWSSAQGQAGQQGYTAPTGPPPTGTAGAGGNETARFVSEAEQGEQREAFEQFEMAKHQPQSSDDRNIETLTREYPGIDSALVAAIYGDSRDMGASREMLGELAGQMK